MTTGYDFSFRIEHSSVLDFFKTLEQCQDRLHTWIGELYLELHQGTFTTHAKVCFIEALEVLQLHLVD